MQNTIKVESEVAESDVQIIESHLDTFLHVNHTIYLQLFEKARWDFLTSRGYGLDAVHTHRAGPVILSAELKFRKEVKNREMCKVLTKCGDYRRMMFKIEQKLINTKGDLACIGNYTCALFDLDTRKIVQPTARFLRAIGLLVEPENAVLPQPEATPSAHLR